MQNYFSNIASLNRATARKDWRRVANTCDKDLVEKYAPLYDDTPSRIDKRIESLLKAQSRRIAARIREGTATEAELVWAHTVYEEPMGGSCVRRLVLPEPGMELPTRVGYVIEKRGARS